MCLFVLTSCPAFLSLPLAFVPAVALITRAAIFSFPICLKVCLLCVLPRYLCACSPLLTDWPSCLRWFCLSCSFVSVSLSQPHIQRAASVHAWHLCCASARDVTQQARSIADTPVWDVGFWFFVVSVGGSNRGTLSLLYHKPHFNLEFVDFKYDFYIQAQKNIWSFSTAALKKWHKRLNFKKKKWQVVYTIQSYGASSIWRIKKGRGDFILGQISGAFHSHHPTLSDLMKGRPGLT